MRRRDVLFLFNKNNINSLSVLFSTFLVTYPCHNLGCRLIICYKMMKNLINFTCKLGANTIGYWPFRHQKKLNVCVKRQNNPSRQKPLNEEGSQMMFVTVDKYFNLRWEVILLNKVNRLNILFWKICIAKYWLMTEYAVYYDGTFMQQKWLHGEIVLRTTPICIVHWLYYRAGLSKKHYLYDSQRIFL